MVYNKSHSWLVPGHHCQNDFFTRALCATIAWDSFLYFSQPTLDCNKSLAQNCRWTSIDVNCPSWMCWFIFCPSGSVLTQRNRLQPSLSLCNSPWFLGWFLVACTWLNIQTDADCGTDSGRWAADWRCLWCCRQWHGWCAFYPYSVRCGQRLCWAYFVAAPISTVGMGLALLLSNSAWWHYQQRFGISWFHCPAWYSCPIRQCHRPNCS